MTPISIVSIVHIGDHSSGWKPVNDLLFILKKIFYKQIFAPGWNLPFGVTNNILGGLSGYSYGIIIFP